MPLLYSTNFCNIIFVYTVIFFYISFFIYPKTVLLCKKSKNFCVLFFLRIKLLIYKKAGTVRAKTPCPGFLYRFLYALFGLSFSYFHFESADNGLIAALLQPLNILRCIKCRRRSGTANRSNLRTLRVCRTRREVLPFLP